MEDTHEYYSNSNQETLKNCSKYYIIGIKSLLSKGCYVFKYESDCAAQVK